MNEIIFCFDIVCPYAYIASHRINIISNNTNSKLIWQPVLLGGLYQLTNALQGANGSATSIMSTNKRQFIAADLLMQAKRYNININYHPNHPVRSLYAQRALIACKDEYREEFARKLYESYWVKNENINEKDIIDKYICDKYNIPDDWYNNNNIKQELRDSTQQAFERGAFGVPTIFIRKYNSDEYHMIWGQDRLHFIDWILNSEKTLLKSIDYNINQFNVKEKVNIKFFFDFSSPWCFLAYTQLKRLESVANIELIPILLGAVFKSIGTSNVPMNSIPNIKRAYLGIDMNRWSEYWNEKLIFPDAFPLRTVLPLRIFIALNNSHKILDIFYRAAWQNNINIGNEDEIRTLLLNNGYSLSSIDEIIMKANHVNIKQKLRDYTEMAISEYNVFGVPTFIYNNVLIWGQDRIDYIIEEICKNSHVSFSNKL